MPLPLETLKGISKHVKLKGGGRFLSDTTRFSINMLRTVTVGFGWIGWVGEWCGGGRVVDGGWVRGVGWVVGGSAGPRVGGWVWVVGWWWVRGSVVEQEIFESKVKKKSTPKAIIHTTIGGNALTHRVPAA